MQEKRGESSESTGKGIKGISYVEIIIAFSVFLLGIALIGYFFIPFFRPELRTALDLMEERFEKDFTMNVSFITVVVNKTGCINFTRPGLTDFMFLNSSFEAMAFDVTSNKIVLNSNEQIFYLLNGISSSLDGSGCSSSNEAKVYFSPAREERLLNMSALQQAQQETYGWLRDKLLPGLKLDFNITLYDGQQASIGKSVPSLNVFAREKAYKALIANKIETVKVRFYVW